MSPKPLLKNRIAHEENLHENNFTFKLYNLELYNCVTVNLKYAISVF